MKKLTLLIFVFIFVTGLPSFAQNILPEISVKNLNGKIIISWLNDYSKPISDILIQRSFDSLKNFSTIGTVLNPQNKENGYPDVNPPYNKMYYRLSITFEGGSYVIGPSTRPVKEIPEPVFYIPNANDTVVETKPLITNAPNSQGVQHPTRQPNTQQPAETNTRFPWQLNQSFDSSVIMPKRDNEVNYPSNRIFTGRQNNVVIHLPEAPAKKYIVKFFDEEDKFLFELTKLNEEYLIIEKVNFVHAGWFHFEVYENGKLIEKNRFLISKDGKPGSKQSP